MSGFNITQDILDQMRKHGVSIAIMPLNIPTTTKIAVNQDPKRPPPTSKKKPKRAKKPNGKVGGRGNPIPDSLKRLVVSYMAKAKSLGSLEEVGKKFGISGNSVSRIARDARIAGPRQRKKIDANLAKLRSARAKRAAASRKKNKTGSKSRPK